MNLLSKTPTVNTRTTTIPIKKFSLRRLSSEDWFWIHFKFAMLVWACLILRFTPEAVFSTLGAVVFAFSIVTIVGVLMSIVGLSMSAQPDRIGLLGLTIEYSGLVFTMTGPVTYFFVQFYLSAKLESGDQRYALTALGYVVFAGLLARFNIVRRARKKVLRSNESA